MLALLWSFKIVCVMIQSLFERYYEDAGAEIERHAKAWAANRDALDDLLSSESKQSLRCNAFSFSAS